MNTIDEVEIDHPSDDNVHFRIERNEMQTGPDEILVHVYQEGGQEYHRSSRFRVEDEEERLAYYVPGRGRSEPWDVAVVGLGLYGWDCTNYDRTVDDEEAVKSLLTVISYTSQVLFSAAEEEYDEGTMMHLASVRVAGMLAFMETVIEAEQQTGRPFDEVYANDDSVTPETWLTGADEYGIDLSDIEQEAVEAVADMLELYEQRTEG